MLLVKPIPCIQRDVAVVNHLLVRRVSVAALRQPWRALRVVWVNGSGGE